MDVIGDLVWLHDAQGLCLDANPAFERLVQTERLQLLGRCLEDVVSARLAGDLWQPDWSALQAGWPCTHETWLTVEGVPHLYEITHIPQRDSAGALVQIQSLGRDITQRHQRIEQSLRDSRRQLADIIDFLPDALLAIDRDKRVIIWNQAIAKLTGIPPEAMLGQGDYAYTVPFYGERRSPLMDLVFMPDAELERRYSNVTREGDILTAEGFCNALHDGRGAWILARVAPLRDAAGQVVGAMEIIRDITERKRNEMRLRQYESMIMAMSDAVALVDSRYRYLIVNDEYVRRTALSREQIQGHTIAELLGESVFKTLIKERFDRCLNGEISQYQEWFDMPAKGRCFFDVCYAPYLDEDGRIPGVISSSRDITELKRMEEELLRLTRLDPLTQLFNRRYFFTLAEQEYQRFRRYHHPMAVCMIDIDHFKSVNDRYGHLIGDAVLCAVAETLRDNLRQVDILARYGGEEFVILWPETDLQTARASAERLRTAVAGCRIETPGGPVSVTLSLGVVSIDDGRSMTLEQLLDAADRMLYRAKQMGRNRVELWELGRSAESD